MLAALKVAIVALSVMFLVSLLWGFYLRPREVAGFLVYCGVLSLLGAYPALSLSVIVFALFLSRFPNSS